MSYDKDITSDPNGKYNGNELDYVKEVLDSENRESRKILCWKIRKKI